MSSRNPLTPKHYPLLSQYESEVNAKTIVTYANKTRMDELLDAC